MRQRFTRGISLLLMVMITFLASVFGLAPRAEASPSGTLEVHMLDVQQGLAVFLRQGDHCMLYDGGGRDTSSFVVAYLKQHGVAHLDYIVASHYDEDHISGLIGAMHAFDCDRILDADYVSDTAIYQSFKKAAGRGGAEEIHPSLGSVYSFGDASFCVVGPENYSALTENDRSVAIRMVYGDTSILLCGDAQQEEEYAIADSNQELVSDIYVVNHHGGDTSSTNYFLNRVQPEYAFLSCGKGNSYGHPKEDVLERLLAHRVKLYRTDKQGTVVAVSDGSTVTCSTAPTEDWTPGETEYLTVTAAGEQSDAAVGSRSMPAADAGISYVLNTRSMKFHYPNCSSVQKMKAKNRQDTTASREEVVAQGYSPCGNCKP